MTCGDPKADCNAEQWHIPPQAQSERETPESIVQARKMRELEAAFKDDVKVGTQGMRNTGKPPTDPFADHLALLPKQPTVIATHVVDLAPLIAWWRDTEQRLRDQLAVERTAASSAREALAAVEERLAQHRIAAEAGTQQHDRMQRELEHARCDAKEAQQMLMDERAKSKDTYDQALQLLRWLYQHAPGGRP